MHSPISAKKVTTKTSAERAGLRRGPHHLMALREPALREVFVAARDGLVAGGVPSNDAPALLAMLDALVRDVLVRGQQPELEPWLRSLDAASGDGYRL